MVMVEMAQVVAVPVVTRMGAGVAVEAELLVRAMLAVRDQANTGLEEAVVPVVLAVLEIIQVRQMVVVSAAVFVCSLKLVATMALMVGASLVPVAVTVTF